MIIREITHMLSEVDVLDQLQEECAELIKAASKIKRVMKNDPHVDKTVARANFIEELADVQVMRMVVMEKLLTMQERHDVCKTVSGKTRRYRDRLKQWIQTQAVNPTSIRFDVNLWSWLEDALFNELNSGACPLCRHADLNACEFPCNACKYGDVEQDNSMFTPHFGKLTEAALLRNAQVTFENDNPHA